MIKIDCLIIKIPLWGRKGFEMKLNWGTGILVAIIGFIAFIMYFIITMTTDKKYDFEMVVDDYYKKEIGFQEELDAQQNALNLSEKIQIQTSTEGVILIFPETMTEVQNGTVNFYRVSQKSLDFQEEIRLQDNQMHIPASRLLPGRWNITLQWESGGKKYMVKENITF